MMKRILRYLIYLLILAAVGYGGYYTYQNYFTTRQKVIFSTDNAEIADIASVISATGTVEPEELVNVGAQVGGMITRFGADRNGKAMDYGSEVKAGMVLANIDDSLYNAALQEATAQKQQALAAISSAEAQIMQNQAKQELAILNWNRAKELQPKGSLSKSDYDNALSETHTTEAAVAVSRAALKQAQAQLASAEASMFKATRNLGYCIIKAPVDGVIIDRRVSIGQTVVSSMNAPSLFLIAKDLRKMQIWVSVNEADIGNIRVGMPVTFTVDAFPDQEFHGEVHRIRLNATMSQNVVTFVVEVSTDNSDGKLLPYLTASVKFIREKRKQVLSVSNAAMRYNPEPTMVAPQYRALVENIIAGNGGERRPGKKNQSDSERMVWVLENDAIRPVKIMTGLTDGISSEVVSGELKAGDRIVTGATVVTVADNTKPEAASPFMPAAKRRKR